MRRAPPVSHVRGERTTATPDDVDAAGATAASARTTTTAPRTRTTAQAQFPRLDARREEDEALELGR